MVRHQHAVLSGNDQRHGVLSAFEEQTKLVSEGLGPNYTVVINSWKKSDILHFHTVNPNYLLRSWFTSAVKVGYVHFLPQTLEGSIRLPRPIQKLLCKYVLLFYKSMDKLIVVNPSFIPKLVECGIPAEKIEYIPNFVDDKQFYPMPQDERLKARQAFGLDTEKFYGSVRRPDAETKGISGLFGDRTPLPGYAVCLGGRVFLWKNYRWI